ncbi:MAG: dihydrodipicolinate synthase family protein, partial [Nitriliruptoraceae bacterium]
MPAPLESPASADASPDAARARSGPAGAFPALVTPLRDPATIDLDGLTTLIHSALADGASGVLVAGTTGEGTLLDPEQRERLTTAARAALAERVNPKLEGETRVGFPAILGDDEARAVRADLSDRLGAEVFEVPMGPPSLPGLRLEDRLFAALDEAGVSIETGNPVTDFDEFEPPGVLERL